MSDWEENINEQAAGLSITQKKSQGNNAHAKLRTVPGLNRDLNGGEKDPYEGIAPEDLDWDPYKADGGQGYEEAPTTSKAAYGKTASASNDDDAWGTGDSATANGTDSAAAESDPWGTSSGTADKDPWSTKSNGFGGNDRRSGGGNDRRSGGFNRDNNRDNRNNDGGSWGGKGDGGGFRKKFDNDGGDSKDDFGGGNRRGGGGFNRDNNDGGNRRGGFNRDNNDGENRRGGFNRDNDGGNRRGGFNRDNNDGENRRGGFNRDNNDGENRRGGFNRDNKDGENRRGGFNRDNDGENRRGGFNRDGDGGNRRGGFDRDSGDGGSFGGKRNGFNNDGDDENGGRRGGRRGGFDKDNNDDENGGRRGGGGFGKNNFDDNNNEDQEEKKREFYIPPELPTDETSVFSSGISTGINFSKYDDIPVKVSGENPPPAVESFEDLGLREIVLNNIQKSGYLKPTPIQKVAMPVVLAGRDLMACAQTGSGKTAAFLVPIINYLLENSPQMKVGKPVALVVAPTRELAIQIYTEARKFSHSSYIRSAILYGGTSSKHQSEQILQGCHILIATPGRLLDFVEKEFINFEETKFVVLDEADRMLDMGFKESIEKVMNHPTMVKDPKPITLMFSATFPNEIQTLAGEYLSNYVFVCIGVVGGACSDVKQTIYELQKFKKRNKLMELLQEGDPVGTIVFVETKRGTDFLASFLSEKDLPSTSIHGDRLQSQREMALRDFKTGKMKILIATSVAARGLDIKNVNHVINFDLPDSIDEYVHRIGRTGRLGNSGRATSFFDPEKDMPLASNLVRILEGANQEVPSFLQMYASGGGSGGGASNAFSQFGGRDIRGKNFGRKNEQEDNGMGAGPQMQEEEESWD